LGLISAFAIPKLLDNSNRVQNKAKMKETIAMVQSLVAEGVATGELNETVDSEAWLVSRLNATKVCNYPQHCTGWLERGAPTYQTTGVVLNTGVAIDFFQVGYTYSLFYVDISDGRVGIVGENLMAVCYNPTGQSLAKQQGGNACMPQQPGQVSPLADDYAGGVYYTPYLDLYK
jgi:hypothetical protein